MLKVLLTVLALIVCSCCRVGLGQNENVYLVQAELPGMQHKVVLTGFRMAGTKGIVTCLHGVAGGRNISANNEQGGVFLNLHVAMVDIPNDLALLRSDELLNAPPDGLQPAAALPQPGQKLTVLGHPAGIKLYPSHPTVGTEVTRPLSGTAPLGAIDALDQRKSPSLDITVIAFEGAGIAPGESGAPALDETGHVVGIVDGGLAGAAIGWAIQPQKIHWEAYGHAESRMQDIISHPVESLFALQTDTTVVVDKITVSQAGDRDYSQIEDALAHAAPGAVITLEPGAYSIDGVRFLKPVTLVGNGTRGRIVLTGVPRLAAPLVTMKHLTLQAGHASIHISHQVVFEDCDLSSSDDTLEIVADLPASLTIRNSLVSSSGGEFHCAIKTRSGSVLEVIDSTISGGTGREQGISESGQSVVHITGTSFRNLSSAVNASEGTFWISRSDFSNVQGRMPISGVGTFQIHESRNTCDDDQFCNDRR